MPEVELLVDGGAGGLGEPAGHMRIPAAGGGQVADGGHARCWPWLRASAEPRTGTSPPSTPDPSTTTR